jgi:hypothetical protein
MPSDEEWPERMSESSLESGQEQLSDAQWARHYRQSAGQCAEHEYGDEIFEEQRFERQYGEGHEASVRGEGQQLQSDWSRGGGDEELMQQQQYYNEEADFDPRYHSTEEDERQLQWEMCHGYHSEYERGDHQQQQQQYGEFEECHYFADY